MSKTSQTSKRPESNSDVSETIAAAATTTRITVKVGGVVKTLFTILLKSSGEVILLLKHAATYREFGLASAESDAVIVEQRYSLHRSLESPDNISFIKQTLALADGKVINTRLVTPVIKNKTGFVPLFGRRVTNLAGNRFDLGVKKPGTLEVTLGDFEPSSLTLLLVVFVGAAELPPPVSTDLVNVFSVVRGDFQTVFIWTYALVPADDTGTYIHQLTEKMPDGSIRGQLPGTGPSETIGVAYVILFQLLDEHGTTLAARGFRSATLPRDVFAMAGFLKDGRSRSVKKRLKILKDAGRLSQFYQLFVDASPRAE